MSRNDQLNDHIQTAINLAKRVKLDRAPGVGRKIEYDEVIELVRVLNKNKP